MLESYCNSEASRTEKIKNILASPRVQFTASPFTVASPLTFTMDDPADSSLSRKNILFELKDVNSEWRKLGIQLNVPMRILQSIEREQPMVDDRMLEMVSKWLEIDVGASWKKLIDALVRIDKNVLAKHLKSHYAQRWRRDKEEKAKAERELQELESRLHHQLKQLRGSDASARVQRIANILEKEGELRVRRPVAGNDPIGHLEQQLKEAEGILKNYEQLIENEKEQRLWLKQLEASVQAINEVVVKKKTREEDLKQRIQQLNKVGGHEKELSECQGKLRECRRQLKEYDRKLQDYKSAYLQHQKQCTPAQTIVRCKRGATARIETLNLVRTQLRDHHTRLQETKTKLNRKIEGLEKETEGGGRLVAKEAAAGFDSGGNALSKVVYGGTGAIRGGWRAIWGSNLETQFNELDFCRQELTEITYDLSKYDNNARVCKTLLEKMMEVLGTFNFQLQEGP